MPNAKSNANANTKANANTNTLSRQAIFYMMLLTIQFGCQPMLTAKYTPKTVCRSTVIMVQEGIKFCLAFFMLWKSGNFEDAVKGWSIASWIKVAALPAMLYTIQNTAALLAYQHLDGVTFNVLNQTKTLSAALCCYLIMGRKQSKIQIIALLMLAMSALVMEHIVSIDFFMGGGHGGDGDDIDTDTKQEEVVLDDTDAEKTAMGTKHFTHGVAPVLFASFLSGLAGAISQKNLQSGASGSTSGGRNPYLFSAELCIASLIVLCISINVSDDGERIRSNGFFHGWTPQTLIPIIANSIGGIVVGLVTKYAGSVRKGFALIFGMLFTGLIQSVTVTSINGDDDSSASVSITKEQIVGGLIASISLWMHATNPYVATTTATATTAVKAPPPSAFRKHDAKKED